MTFKKVTNLFEISLLDAAGCGFNIKFGEEHIEVESYNFTLWRSSDTTEVALENGNGAERKHEGFIPSWASPAYSKCWTPMIPFSLKMDASRNLKFLSIIIAIPIAVRIAEDSVDLKFLRRNISSDSAPHWKAIEKETFKDRDETVQHSGVSFAFLKSTSSPGIGDPTVDYFIEGDTTVGQ